MPTDPAVLFDAGDFFSFLCFLQHLSNSLDFGSSRVISWGQRLQETGVRFDAGIAALMAEWFSRIFCVVNELCKAKTSAGMWGGGERVEWKV